METPCESEFSRRYPVDKIQARSQVLKLKAKPEECDAVAKRFDLIDLKSLSATLELDPKGKGSLLDVKGHLKAEVTQFCIITAEPVPSIIDEPFEIMYSFEPIRDTAEEILIDIDAEDPPELADPTGIDFGEAIVQQLAVMLDPYPKAPNSTWDGDSVDEAPDEEEMQEAAKTSPFSVLKDLQIKK
ncbi:YceD family protein [Kiloniella majae]|uniref:YceD family protein n=1 Tax=Kiloniella majae TaxID=1938558 RepID=UPI000A276E42|nr:YceD family protein [Kiloniella majae]